MDAKSTEKKHQKTKAPPHKKSGKNNSKKKSKARPDSSGNRSDSSRHMTSPADDLEPQRLEDQTNKDENNDDNRDETYEDNRDSVHNENNDDKKEASDNDHDDTGDDEKNNNDDDDEIFFDDPILSREFETRSGAPYNGYYGADAANPGLSTRQAKIIKDILANFDLEKVMDRYRGETVYRSLNKRNRRVWLEGMMGNEKVPFNDRKWNEAFKQKVMNDLERQQDERERRLADAETQRILKLKLQGVIKDEEQTDRGFNHNRQSVSERKFERRKAKKHESLFKPAEDIESQMEILHRDESDVRRRHKPASENGEDEENGNSDENGNDDIPTYKSELGRTCVEKPLEVHPDLEKLYKEEDLKQLYMEAECLVHLPPARHKK